MVQFLKENGREAREEPLKKLVPMLAKMLEEDKKLFSKLSESCSAVRRACFGCIRRPTGAGEAEGH